MKQDNKQVTDTSNLTKDEAIAAMLKGEKVRHEYFTDNEWAKLNGHFEIEFEDGCKIDVDTFWADRKGSQWQTGWSILPQPTDTGNTVSSEVGFTMDERPAISGGMGWFTINPGLVQVPFWSSNKKDHEKNTYAWYDDKDVNKAKETAQRIVQAVNNHDALKETIAALEERNGKLVEALQDVVNSLTTFEESNAWDKFSDGKALDNGNYALSNNSK